MELAIRIHVEQLPEGLFLATSDELPGLVAQGRTVAEALDIARDVARKLIEARSERDGQYVHGRLAGSAETTVQALAFMSSSKPLCHAYSGCSFRCCLAWNGTPQGCPEPA